MIGWHFMMSSTSANQLRVKQLFWHHRLNCTEIFRHLTLENTIEIFLTYREFLKNGTFLLKFKVWKGLTNKNLPNSKKIFFRKSRITVQACCDVTLTIFLFLSQFCTVRGHYCERSKLQFSVGKKVTKIRRKIVSQSSKESAGEGFL